MAYYITSECIACGRCFKNCPVEAIYPGDGQYEIGPDKCIDCGACASLCPISAIKEEK